MWNREVFRNKKSCCRVSADYYINVEVQLRDSSIDEIEFDIASMRLEVSSLIDRLNNFNLLIKAHEHHLVHRKYNERLAAEGK